MTRSILVTGATGMVGSALIGRLLEDEASQVIATVRPARSQGGGQGRLPPHERLTAIETDVTEPDLGWTAARHHRLSKEVTHICHLAASTRFHLPLEELRLVNVRGTEHVLAFAERCASLERFGFASTVFVSGRRTGHVLERERAHGAGFVNAYEQSKYEAEARVHFFADRVPVSIYRLSTILGDSRSGEVRHYTAPHQALRIMSLGLASMLPGTAGYTVNLIPSDVAADALARLLVRPGPDEPGRTTYHLAAPDAKCFTLEELVEESYQRFAELIPGWARRNYPKPAIVSRQAFDRFMESVTRTGNPLLGKVVGALGHFAHQLLYPKSFDLTNTATHLPGYRDGLPDIRTYFGRVVEHCVRMQWGSHAPAE